MRKHAILVCARVQRLKMRKYMNPDLGSFNSCWENNSNLANS